MEYKKYESPISTKIPNTFKDNEFFLIISSFVIYLGGVDTIGGDGGDGAIGGIGIFLNGVQWGFTKFGLVI